MVAPHTKVATQHVYVKPECCEKCGSSLRLRTITIGGERLTIWQCRVCQYHVPTDP